MASFISTVSYFSTKLGENTTYGKGTGEIVTWENEDLHVYLERNGETLRVQIYPIINDNFGGGDWDMAHMLVGYCQIRSIPYTCVETMISIEK